MNHKELTIILDGFRSGALDTDDLKAVTTDPEAWIAQSESPAAALIRDRRAEPLTPSRAMLMLAIALADTVPDIATRKRVANAYAELLGVDLS